MPRLKKSFQKHKGKKHYGKHNSSRKPQKMELDKKKKNLKFIKRSKEAEETQRRQKIIEENYKSKSAFQMKADSDDSMSDSDEKVNPFEQLVAGFQRDGHENANKISDSTDEESDAGEDDEESDDDENDEELDDAEENLSEVQSNSEASSLIGSVENSDGEELSEDDLEIEEEEDDGESNFDENTENSSNSDDQSLDDEDNENEAVDQKIIEEELDDEMDELNTNSNISDPFSIHLDRDISSVLLESLTVKPPRTRKETFQWPTLGKLQIDVPTAGQSKKEVDKSKTSSKRAAKHSLVETESYATEGKVPILTNYKTIDLNQCNVKTQLVDKFVLGNQVYSGIKAAMTPLQAELFSVMNNYQDLFYPNRTLDNGEEIRFLYSLHVLNHILKTRMKILHHNAKLTANSNGKKENTIVPDSYRDQGLVRPKVLILLPFRDSAHRVVNNFVKLLFGEKEDSAKSSKSVINYKRFEEEFTGDTIKFPSRNPKPEDYEKTFAGNTDDTFRIGISFTKKSMKLYTEFYSSDVLIASPLGLRMIIGAPGEAERDYDFLASIELLILDQAELFLAQNWDHLLHVFDHLHLQPQSVRSTDFSRVRSWCLNGWSRFYRQTMLFTTHELPEFRSLFNSRCVNYRGKLRTVNPIVDGSIRHVITQIPQVFHKIDVSSIETSFDTRFKYFINEILPQFTGPSMAHCMIYVPSYFDFVRLRNHFKAENMNFVQISEYTKDGKIARARDMFFHSAAHFLLYSERAHFFRRTRVKGIRHLIMYQPPFWPYLYSEMVNLMQDANQNSRDGLESSMSVTILYTKYDMLQTSAIIGTDQAAKVIQSPKTTCMFMTGD